MNAKIRPLQHYEQTVSEIWRLAEQYSADIKIHKKDKFSFYEFWLYVRSLPYVADPENVEVVARPGLTIDHKWTGPRDCDDKAVLLLAYVFAVTPDIIDKYRLAVVGELSDYPHHIYPEVLVNDLWLPIDATYPENKIYDRMYVERFRKVYYYKKK